jgi:hypothetical protein
MEDVQFDLNYPFLINIGDNCRVAKGVRILAHDATTFRDLGITRIAPVTILEGTFIGERAIILPGVTIGPRALIAAGSVVNRDIPEGKAVAGNPARPYSTYADILDKYREISRLGVVIDKRDIEKGSITHKDIIQVFAHTSTAFVKGVPREDPYYINTDMAKIRKDALSAYHQIIDVSHTSDQSSRKGGNKK